MEHREGTDLDGANEGIVYVGRIPHGFYEKEMKEYFTQFGEIKRLRISRNKRTGKSRHRGWIQFKHPEVANVVAKTMNNYLLDGHLLKIELLEPSAVPLSLFKGDSGTRPFKKIPHQELARKRHNKERTKEQKEKVITKLIEKEKKKRKLIKEAGIDYDFPGYEGKLEKPRRKRKRVEK